MTETAYEDEQNLLAHAREIVSHETPDLPQARLDWFDRSPNRKIGSVNGHVVYVVQWKALDTEFKIFHRLPVKQIDKTFKTSDLAKLFADTHLHQAMRVLGFVAR